MKKSYLSLIIFISFFCLSCSSHNTQNSPQEDGELLKRLVFHKAHAIVSGYDNRLKITAISYKVNLKYPSKEVLEFCDIELKKMDWQEYVSPLLNKGTRIWTDFWDGTTEGSPYVHQLIAIWNNKEKSKMISLMLRYYSYGQTSREKLHTRIPNTEILDVIIQIEPYAEGKR